MLIDTHNHLYFEAFDADRDAVLARMRERSIAGALMIGIDPPSNEKARDCVLASPASASGPRLEYSIGLHPTSSFEPDYFDPDGRFLSHLYLAHWWDEQSTHLGHPPIAIGECGIDLYWDTNPLPPQQAVFQGQLEFARERDLPVIIHTRKADCETLEVLEAVPGTRGVFHCFNGSDVLLDFALRDFARGGRWYISFAGNLTNGDKRLEEAARRAPLERLLVETDAPFMTPRQVRELSPKGAKPRCEPAHVAYTAEVLAGLRGMSFSELSMQTSANACACFGVNWLAG